MNAHDFPSVKPTPIHKAFGLVQSGSYAEAARAAVRAINNAGGDGRVPGREFFIYSNHPEYAKERWWLDALIEKGSKGKFIEFFSITPVRAQVLLERNEGNRQLRYETFTERLTDVANGRRQVNGETLIVSIDGKLNDGQNRLFAALLSGRTIETGIAFGVDRETIKTVDSGGMRSVGDRLGFDGVSNPKPRAATALLALRVLEGRVPTKSEVENYYNANKALIELAHEATPTIVRRGNDAAFRVAALYLLRRGEPFQDIYDFVARVRNGDKSKKKGCAAWSLREGITAGTVLSREQWVATIVAHYMAWSRNKQAGGLHKEATLEKLP